MIETLTNFRGILGTSERASRLVIVAIVALVAVGTWYALTFDRLLLAAGAVAGLLALLVSLRWPLLPLYAFAALIPIESVVQFGDLGTISRIAGILFMLAWAVPRIGRLTLAATPAAGWLLVAWATLSLGWALDSSVTALHLATLIQLFAVSVFVADVVVQRPDVVRRLLWAYSLSATVTAGIGVGELLTNAAAQGQRIAAFSDQDVAQFAAILLPALVFSLFELVNGRALIVSSVVLLTSTAGIVLSGTRGAWISSIVVFGIFILPELQPRRRLAAVVTAVFILLLTFQLPGVTDFIGKRADLALRTGGAGRTDVWAVGITIFQSSPLIGVGFENFPVAYTPERVDASSVASLTSSGFASHSIIVGTLAELGIIGAIVTAAYLLPLLYRRGWGQDATMIRAALASLLIAGLFLDVLNRKQVWLLIGIAAGLLYLSRRHRSVDAPTRADGGKGARTDLGP